MACGNSCHENTVPTKSCGNSYIILIVLYILLAIILGASICC